MRIKHKTGFTSGMLTFEQHKLYRFELKDCSSLLLKQLCWDSKLVYSARHVCHVC